MLNQNIFYFINALAFKSNFADSLIVFFASILPIILGAFIFVYFIFIKKSPLKFFSILGMVLVPASIGLFLQYVVFRHPRPFAVLPHVKQLISINSFTSFPSMHTTIFFALAMAVFMYNKKLGFWLFVSALIIGISRIAAGVHFPVDILFGAILGTSLSYFSYLILRKMSRAIEGIFS